MNVSPALRAFMARSIDYAGLFPPASLQLEPALKNYRAYLDSEDAWMLSTFVLPIAKFGDAAWLVSQFSSEKPLRLSALGPRTINAIDYAEELKNISKGVRQLRADARDVVQIEQLEMPLPAGVTAVSTLPLRTFWEAAPDDAPRTIEMLAASQGSSGAQPLGFKLRTGGVTADAFPTSRQIARVLVTAAKYNVPVKFTAGLHHPVRMFREEVKTTMHGFLNVLGAGLFAREQKWDEEQSTAMLEDEDAGAFRFTDESFHWRDFQMGVAAIAKQRAFITSFGSCSFDEPREDLRELKML